MGECLCEGEEEYLLTSWIRSCIKHFDLFEMLILLCHRHTSVRAMFADFVVTWWHAW